MKFLPENRKKTIGALVLLAVSLGGTIYINFFMGKNDAPLPPVFIPAVSPAAQTQPTGTAPPAATAQSPSMDASVLLPFGSRIDISVFESDKYKALKGVPPVSVSPGELGKTDPFQ